MQNVAFRLPNDLVARLDAHLVAMGVRMPGVTLTRSDAVRELLIRALDHTEAGGSFTTPKPEKSEKRKA